MMNNGMMQGMGMGRGGMMGAGQPQQNVMVNGMGAMAGGMGGGMGASMGGPQGFNPQMQPQLQHLQQQQVLQKHILYQLRQQPTRAGWQSVLNISIRVQNVHQLLTQLRLLKGNELGPEQALNVALSFESKTFNESPDQATYESTMRAKQTEVHASRSKQAQGLEQQLQNPRAMNMGMVPQRGMLNGPMQNGMPNQPFNQVGPGYLNPQMPQHLQRQAMPMQPQPPHQQPGPGMMGIQMPRNQNQMQTGPGGQPNVPPQLGPHNFTQQELMLINRLGVQLHNQATPQEREQVRQRILSGPPKTLHELQTKNIPPVQWYYRQLAVKQFLMQKKQQEGRNQPQQGNGGGGPGSGIPGQPNPAQNMANGPPPQFGPGQQGLGTNFGGNIQQIMGLQENALREQEAGRVVVPASQQQRINGQPPAFDSQVGSAGMPNAQQQMLKQQGMLPNGRPNMGQGQARPSNMAIQPQRQTPLQGQNGGLGTSAGQGMPPQQSPAMPNLNRAVDPNTSRPPSQTQQKQQPPRSDPTPTPGQATQSTPQTGKPQQPQQQPQSSQGPNNVQNNPSNLPHGFNWNSLPEHIKLALRKMTQQERDDFFAKKLKALAANRNQNPNSQASQGQQSQNTSATTEKSGTGPNTTATGQPNNVLPNLNPSAMNPPRLTQEQIKEMDTVPFPRGMLNAGALLQHIPGDVKTWGQLKEWCRNNRHIVSEEAMRKLDSMQALQRQMATSQMLRQALPGQQQNGQRLPPAASGQPGPAPMAPMAQPPRQNQPPNQPPHNILSHPSFQISPKDVQILRSKMPPQMQGLSDDQIKMFFARKRIAQMNQHALDNNKPPPFPNAMMNGNTNQPNQQPQGPTQQHFQSPVPTGLQGKLPNQGPGQAGIKRPNDGPIGQVSNAASQQIPVPAANQGLVQMKKEPSNHGQTSTTQPQPPSQASTQLQRPQQLGPGPPPNAQVDQLTMLRFRKVYEEVRSTYRARPSFPIDENRREDWSKLFDGNKEFLQRYKVGALQYFSTVDGNEDHLRDILRQCIALSDLFHEGKSAPTSQATMSFEEAFGALNNLRKLFYQTTLKRREKEKETSHPSDQRVNTQLSTAPPQTQTKQPEPAAQPMAKQQSKQKHNRDKEPPPAPTTDKPPFTFGGSPPPHGVPIYGQNAPGVTQDQLSLPQKRRKLNNQQAKDQHPAPLPDKRAAPAPPKPEPAFKCQWPGCEYAKKGFTSGEDLAQHVDKDHKEKDPEDPLAFALEQARAGLSLDASGKAVIKERPPRMEKSLSAQPMKQSASAQGPTPRLEGGTPMSRGTTHLSNLGAPRTPQPGGKPVEGKGTPQPGQSQAERATPLGEPATPDSWSDLGLTPQDLAAHFPEVGDMQGSLSLSSLTPASTLTTKSGKNTPKSDIGEDTAIKINIDSDSWLPAGFLVDCYDRDIDTSFVNDDVLGMDWETAFPDSGEKPKGRKRGQDDGFRADLFGVHLGV